MTARVVLNEACGGPLPLLPDGPPAFHRALPGYRPTPLVDCPAVAAAAAVRRVLVKDESDRFGLPAFKYLGASWALARLLGSTGTIDALRTAAHQAGVERLAAATDGNHGRAVARLARQLGLRATIHVPAGMVAARRAAIAGEGADVVVVQGGYDAAVRAAAADAADPGCRVLADADLDGASPVPGWVIDGYATLFAEVDEELARRGHAAGLVLLQIGVGAFAAAGARWARRAGAAAVGAEPAGAACVAASLAAGRPVEIEPSGTVMAGLEAGSPSRAAWPTVAAGLVGVVVLADAAALAAVDLLARDGVRSGESGAAGVAGLLALAQDPGARALRERIGWRDEVTVLCISTEGPTS